MQNTASHPTKKQIFPFVNLGILALLIGLVAWVLYKFDFFRSDRCTDNAQVRRHLVPVNARVQGYLREIEFQEFTRVREGDTIAVIDDSEHVLRLRQAEATLAIQLAARETLRSSLDTIRNNLLVSDAGIGETKTRLDNAETDLRRFTALLAENVVTPSQYDRANTEASALRARHDMQSRQRRSIELALEEQSRKLEELNAGIRQAQAAVDLAKLNLSYTRITAPCSGFIGRKEIQPGQLIQPGQTLVEIVDEAHTWVIANFKERRTATITPGATVRVQVDALSGQVYEGRVAAISGATGSAYSLVPSDNASGNFIKIEQLIPVRIDFTENNSKENMARLRSGMSAVVSIEKSP